MKTTVGRTALEIVVGDITELAVDAVANAANTELWMGAGVAGALKRVGGDEVEREAMAQGPIALGEAVATHGHGLKAPWVIHAAVMGPDLQTDAQRHRHGDGAARWTLAGWCALARSPCRPSAPGSAASRSTSAPASWWPRRCAT